MGKKDDKKFDGGHKKKRGKKKKEIGAPIEEALACPPSARFFHELVVGNGIGDNAVEDAAQAYQRAFESRREKALDAARHHEPECGKSCKSGEHFVTGPFMSPQQWRIEEKDPVRATTWSWLGYYSIHFCRKS
jgi:hypothetical protein